MEKCPSKVGRKIDVDTPTFHPRKEQNNIHIEQCIQLGVFSLSNIPTIDLVKYSFQNLELIYSLVSNIKQYINQTSGDVIITLSGIHKKSQENLQTMLNCHIFIIIILN